MKKGFTLIELLITISIIAILSTIGLVTFQGVQAKARDATRKNDLRAIATALEIYYQKNGAYPKTDEDPVIGSSAFPMGMIFSSTSNLWIPGLDSTYINPLPLDPLNIADNTNTENILTANSGSYLYSYWAGDPPTVCKISADQYYILVTRLENTGDPERNELKAYKKCDGSPIAPPTYISNSYKQLYFVTSQD